MNRLEFVNAVYNNVKEDEEIASRVNKKIMTDIIDYTVETLKAAMADGEEVKLTGFATFTTAEVAERSARNPRTGEPIVIAAHRKPVVKFVPSFKKFVNEG